MIETIIVIFLFIGLMLLIYFKIPSNYAIKFPLILVIFLFSVVIGISLMVYETVGSPYIHLFFLIFQGIFVYITSQEYYDIKKRSD